MLAIFISFFCAAMREMYWVSENKVELLSCLSQTQFSDGEKKKFQIAIYFQPTSPASHNSCDCSAHHTINWQVLSLFVICFHHFYECRWGHLNQLKALSHTGTFSAQKYCEVCVGPLVSFLNFVSICSGLHCLLFAQLSLAAGVAICPLPTNTQLRMTGVPLSGVTRSLFGVSVASRFHRMSCETAGLPADPLFYRSQNQRILACVLECYSSTVFHWYDNEQKRHVLIQILFLKKKTSVRLHFCVADRDLLDTSVVLWRFISNTSIWPCLHQFDPVHLRGTSQNLLIGL